MFFLRIRPPPIPSLFPNTTLSRSDTSCRDPHRTTAIALNLYSLFVDPIIRIIMLIPNIHVSILRYPFQILLISLRQSTIFICKRCKIFRQDKSCKPRRIIFLDCFRTFWIWRTIRKYLNIPVTQFFFTIWLRSSCISSSSTVLSFVKSVTALKFSAMPFFRYHLKRTISFTVCASS